MRRDVIRVESPLGPIAVTTAADGVHEVRFVDDTPSTVAPPTSAGREIAARIARWFDGDLAAFDDVVVAAAGTPFRRRVWAALRRIPPGTTTTYGALAAAIGRPGAARAVGRANATNPVTLIVPCHRVIGADGALVGYAGGMDRKRRLLDHERTSLRLVV